MSKSGVLLWGVGLGLLMPMYGLKATQGTIDFHHLTNRDGLSMNTVVALAQDSSGYLWIGTEDGLNRYDGHQFRVFRPHPWKYGYLSGSMIESLCVDRSGVLWVGTRGRGLNRFDAVTETFTVYRHDPTDSTSLAHNTVYSIHEDSKGQLWVGTHRGLCRLDRKTGRFTRFLRGKAENGGLSGNIIMRLLEDHRGNLWIGTIGGGLTRWHLNSGRISHYTHDPNNSESLCHNQVTRLYEDRDGQIWVGTYNGLSRLAWTELERPRFVSFYARPGDSEALQSGYITGLVRDRAGVLWVATWGGGLHRLRKDGRSFDYFRHNPDENRTLCSDRIYTLFEDASGVVWIGGHIGGLDRFHPFEKKFIHIFQSNHNPNGLNDNSVYSFCEAPIEGRMKIWVGTNQGGINIWDPGSGEFIHLLHDPDDPRSLRNNRIFSLLADRDGQVWAGTFGGGLNRFDGFIEKADGRVNGKFTAFTHVAGNAHSLSDNRIFQLLQDKRGMLWIATWSGGVNIFNPETEDFTCYRHVKGDSTTLSDNQIMAILEDRYAEEPIFWIGTNSGGLNKLNATTGHIEHFRHNRLNPSCLSSDDAAPLYQDAEGRIWMATYGAGIDILDPNTGKVSHLTVDDGLPNNIIMAIVPDEMGRLWISTYRGLCVYTPETGQIKKYQLSDGLQDYEYNMLVGMKSSSGDMFFGGNRGFNVFRPQEVVSNGYQSPVKITEITFLNPELNDALYASINESLRQPVPHSKKFVLSYGDFPVTFNFASMDYRFPDQNQYQYQLLGLDSRWHLMGNRNTVSYTGLEPGAYTLNVRASNSDGVWSTQMDSVAFGVAPPYWRSFWFKVLILLALGAVVFAVHLWRVRIIRARSRALAEMNTLLKQEVDNRRMAEEETARSLKEKELLLKEIHHRVKNNLQVISSLLSLQSRKLGEHSEARVMFAESRNRVRSMALIHECLYKSRDFSSIDFSEYFRELSRYLYQVYQVHPGRVRLDVQVKEISLGIDDAVPCGLIVNELLSNALKHAFPTSFRGHGVVTLAMKNQKNKVSLRVQDNGVGIDDDFNLDHLESLGMKMVSILVKDQLKGTLEIIKSSGTIFNITFPAGRITS